MSINIETETYKLTVNQQDTYLPANSPVASQLQKYEQLVKMNLLLLQLDFHKLNGHVYVKLYTWKQNHSCLAPSLCPFSLEENLWAIWQAECTNPINEHVAHKSPQQEAPPTSNK